MEEVEVGGEWREVEEERGEEGGEKVAEGM